MTPLARTALLATLTVLTLGLPRTVPAAAPCGEPLRYSIGEVDDRYDLTRDQFRRAIGEAVALWEQAARRDLFTHDPDADFRIHLEYAKPQRATEAVDRLDARANTLERRIRRLKERHQEDKGALERQQQRLEKDMEAFRERKSRLARRVERARQGGLGAEEKRELNKRQESLNERARSLNRRSKTLEKERRGVNRTARRINQLIHTLKKQVAARNDLAGPDDPYRQGVFQQDRQGQRQITIRRYTGPHQLRYVLAHELGHALGIGHVDDPEAVMYYLSEEGDPPEAQLTGADRRALQGTCE